MKQFLVIIILFSGVVFSNAQEQSNSVKKNIFENLATPDSVSGAVAVITQDKKIEKIMLNPQSNTTTVTGGYRVQVFSSNTQRTAKSQAYKIEKELREVFPDYAIYVTYAAPFWKVRIGDFRTQKDAQELRTEIIKAFPTLRSETYTVRDHVTL
jgi:hypothetical protein